MCDGFPETIPPQILLERDQYMLDVMFRCEFFLAGGEDDCYMGIALGTAQVGDWICMLAGGGTP